MKSVWKSWTEIHPVGGRCLAGGPGRHGFDLSLAVIFNEELVDIFTTELGTDVLGTDRFFSYPFPRGFGVGCINFVRFWYALVVTVESPLHLRQTLDRLYGDYSKEKNCMACRRWLRCFIMKLRREMKVCSRCAVQKSIVETGNM